MGTGSTGQSRHKTWRLRTVLPAVLITLAAVATGGVIHSTPPASAPVSFADGTPIGTLDKLVANPGGLRAVGWAFDPNDKTAAARVNARVDGDFVAGMAADIPRDDVAAAYPKAGANHGFNFFVPVPEGEHTVCIRVKNVGDGSNLTLNCVTKTFDYGPRGALETLATQPGHLVVSGWVIDWDEPTDPVTVNVLIDSTTTKLIANKFRKDIATSRPAAGGNHGFAATLPLAQGTHQICVTAVNIGYGSNNSLGCKSITLNDNPVGAIDSVKQSNGALKITGWAFDNDNPTAALTVTLVVDGLPHFVTANTPRKDIGSKYPTAGPNHGFVATYKLAEGSHKVCVTVHNVGYGVNTVFPCRTAVLNFTPTAVLTSLTPTSTGLHIRGWAADPDTSQPISVEVTVDGRLARTQVADGDGLGHDGHVFSADMLVKSGAHKVCVTGLNTLYGTHDSQPSCGTITLALKPLGAFEALTRVSGSSNLRVKGWALDPDTRDPITVRMTLDGVAAGTATADATRTDIGDKYAPWGDNHGLWAKVTADDGEHTLCVTAVNVGGGADVQLGCKLIIAVHPVPPSAPRNVQAIAGYGGAEVTWSKPTYCVHGAPPSGRVRRAQPSSV